MTAHQAAPGQAAADQLAAIAAALTAIEADIAAGRPITLTAVTADIEDFCGEVPAMDPVEARALMPGLQAIVTQLDNLTGQFAAAAPSVPTDTAVARQQAARAYSQRPR